MRFAKCLHARVRRADDRWSRAYVGEAGHCRQSTARSQMRLRVRAATRHHRNARVVKSAAAHLLPGTCVIALVRYIDVKYESTATPTNSTVGPSHPADWYRSGICTMPGLRKWGMDRGARRDEPRVQAGPPHRPARTNVLRSARSLPLTP
jgi:hypothetical protein